MACGIGLIRAAALAAFALATFALVPAAQAAPSTGDAQVRAIGTGCEPNGLPSSLALCNGSGRLNVKLDGTVVLSVLSGQVTLKGQAKRVCKRKRVKRNSDTAVWRRVCSKRAKPILPRVATRKARGYTIYTGKRLFFYLPPGKWRISARGDGVSLSAVGEGSLGVRSRAPSGDGDVTAGLISVGGELYDEWPRRWTRFDFGRDVELDDDADRGRSSTTSSSTTSSVTASSSQDAPVHPRLTDTPAFSDQDEVQEFESNAGSTPAP